MRERSSPRCSTRVASSPCWRRRGRRFKAMRKGVPGELGDGVALALLCRDWIWRDRMLVGGRELRGEAVVHGLVVVALPEIESLNSRIPLPSERPISGRRFGPKMISRATRRMTSSVTPIPNGMAPTLPPFVGVPGPFRRRAGAIGYHGITKRRCKPALIQGKRDHKLGVSGDQEPPCRARGRHRDRQGCRPLRRPEREARDHGPERLRQVDARLRADGPPGLRDHRGRDPARRREHRRGRRRRARAEGSLPRLPVPARDSGRDRDELPAERDQRDPQGEGRQGRSDPGQGVPHRDPRRDGAAEGAARARLALPERRLLGRREEARRDPADGAPAAEDRDPRRDRLRARHRRAAHRRQGRQRARRPRAWARS